MDHKAGQSRNLQMVKPLLAEVEVTSICNADCIFCPRGHIPSPHHMTSETWKRVLDRLGESGIRSVKLAGFGEPTLHPEILSMLDDLRRYDFEVLLNTNLSKLHVFGAETILARCDEIIASVHTLKPEVYRHIVGRDWFHQIRTNLDILLAVNRSFGRHIAIYVVVTRLNMDAPEEFSPYENEASLRISGCSNRVVESFPVDIIDLESNSRHNSYPEIDDDHPVCGYASAAIVIDCDGQYLQCTNDIARKSAHESVHTLSIRTAAAVFNRRMQSIASNNFCLSCENSAAYRNQLKRIEKPGNGAIR